MSILVGEILGLLQTALSLVNKKSELDKQYFEQFILPAWDAFRKVHEDYKASFYKYMDVITNESTEVVSMIEMIRNDSIYTNDLRVELLQMVDHMPSIRFKTKEDYLIQFCKSIIKYFNVNEHVDSDVMPPRKVDPFLPFNPSRDSIIYHLQREGKIDTKTKELINRILMILQNNFEEVSKSYQQLRTALLS